MHHNGYLGLPTLSLQNCEPLSESFGIRWLPPHMGRQKSLIRACVHALGGVGEKIVWASGFDGLGRLVARELGRALRLDDAPTCDFSIDEAIVLADSSLSDPLVHLRIKQARLVTVALYPGTNITVPIADQVVADQRKNMASERDHRSVAERNHLRTGDTSTALIELLWPQIVSRIESVLPRLVDNEIRRSGSPKTSGRGKKGGQLL